jgi:choline dehydrogenase
VTGAGTPGLAPGGYDAPGIVGALRLPVTISGMIEASTTRRPSRPWTRPSPSTIRGRAPLPRSDAPYFVAGDAPVRSAPARAA